MLCEMEVINVIEVTINWLQFSRQIDIWSHVGDGWGLPDKTIVLYAAD